MNLKALFIECLSSRDEKKSDLIIVISILTKIILIIILDIIVQPYMQ